MRSLFDKPQARSTDPETSREAWKRAAKSKRAVAVAGILIDCVGRTDEQTHEAATLSGWNTSRTSVCQGRKILERLGLVFDTGERRKTSLGRASIVWQWRDPVLSVVGGQPDGDGGQPDSKSSATDRRDTSAHAQQDTIDRRP